MSISGALKSRLASIVESTGAKSVSDLWKSTLGLRIFFDGNLFISVVEHTPKGNLVGTDQFGNKYYENKELPYDRSRWVMYGDLKNYNPSSIPAEWHGWVNYINDYPPTTHEYKKPIYGIAHTALADVTGTPAAYWPKGHWIHSKPRNWQKYEAWVPPSNGKQ